MSNILIYYRSKNKEIIAEQTVNLLVEQLQLAGHQVDICQSLNIPRLILNSYQSVHVIIENLPLTTNEIFHIGVCKALGKATILSVLNSDKNFTTGLINLFKPDALSVSQTNHLKYYRNFACNKFVFSAFPQSSHVFRKSHFKHEAFLIPLHTNVEDVFDFKIEGTVFFDGRNLLQKNTSTQLRKKWTELVATKKLSDQYHLVLSDNKLKELLEEQSLSVVLADPNLSHVEFINWLSKSLNKKNLIILNEYQATGFSNYWTSGHNCQVIQAHDWVKALSHIKINSDMICSSYKANELFEPTVNELSRLYSKLWHQKTSLLTSGSVKL